MKERLKKIVAAAKAYAQRAKLIVTQVETAVHAAAVAAIGGGVDALYMQYHATGHIVFTAAQLIEAKVHFFSGAALALLAWLKAAPGLKSKTEQSQPATQ